MSLFNFWKQPKGAKATSALPGANLPGANPDEIRREDFPLKAPRDDDMRDQWVGVSVLSWQNKMKDKVIAVLMFVVVILSMTTYDGFSLQHTIYKYFAINREGQITPLVALNKPFITNSGLINWTNNAVTHALSFDAANWRMQIQGSSHYFTHSGFNDFVNKLKTSGTLKELMHEKLMQTCIQTGATVITSHGHMKNGVYGWEVQMPVKILMENSHKSSDVSYVAKVIIKRVPTMMAPLGIAIQSISLVQS
jgi:intracellular multiplication protein IcmL